MKHYARNGPEWVQLPEHAPALQPDHLLTDCGEDEQVVAMAYVPNQQWTQVYEAELGLARGTIFPELDLPFVGEGACRHE